MDQIPSNQHFRTPMLNGGTPYQDQTIDSTFEQRLAPDPNVEARRQRIYDQRPIAVKVADQERQAAEQAQKDKVMREIELRVNTFILKLLAQKLAMKAPQARKATEQRAHLEAAQRYNAEQDAKNPFLQQRRQRAR